MSITGDRLDATQLLFDYLDIRKFAFPNNHNIPTEYAKALLVRSVTFDVSGKLHFPELRIALGNIAKCAALMPVPETAMDEDGGPISRKNNVRPAGEILAM